jgi:hypothetical protein
VRVWSLGKGLGLKGLRVLRVRLELGYKVMVRLRVRVRTGVRVKS